ADMRPESFTVEAMVWFPEGATSVNNWNVIAVHPAKMTCANADAWGFRFTGPNQIIVRFTRPREYTPTAGKEDTYDKVTDVDNVSVGATVPAINDGRWHHVAFTAAPNGADSSKTDVKVFFDYNQVASSTLDFRPQFSGEDDCPVWVGSTRQSYGFFTGAIGEFRLSNVALTPGEFLRSHDAGLDKDVVLYYDFETLGESGQIVNIASPGIMDGTIVTNTANSNLAPEFVEDTPVARIRQSLHETTWQESEKSLCNYVVNPGLAWDSVNRCGYVKCQPVDTAWFSKMNFTVETFFMTTNNVQKWNSFFQRKGGWNVQFQMGISTAGGTVGYNITTNETIGQVEQQASSFTVGEWHHFAVVVDQTGETKRLTAYLDKKIVKQISLDSRITQNNKSNLYDYNGAWFIAGGPSDCAFDGKLDSMRVTLRALGPAEFMTSRGFPQGSTITRLSFEDETPNASAEFGTLCEGRYQGASGFEPTYPDDVPGVVIRDGEAGEVLTKHNLKSISFPDTTNHSWFAYGALSSVGKPMDVYYLHYDTNGVKRTAGTIEFWMKSSQTDADWDSVVLELYKAGGIAWIVWFDGNHQIHLGFGASVAGWKYAIASGVNVLDGKWHHVAFTYGPNAEDESMMDAKAYVDYNCIATTTVEGHMNLDSTNDYFDFRLGGQRGHGHSEKNFGGLLDELRISDCALEPSQFLRAEHAPGFSIIIR
ncbi:MAG: LamG domain-containing protein, partial [Kiritimatiellae bacterium]|nr:LamG domain-containing protein [Kiritimatiellia bacterium]